MLDGALALALPTRPGQSLHVDLLESPEPELHWKSFTDTGDCWFSGRFALPEGNYLDGTDRAVGERLEQILRAGKKLRPSLWPTSSPSGYAVRTELEFPRNWGLGTSSTLIANLAQWWRVDPYQLLADTFGGSGYDLACAASERAVFYQLEAGAPQVTPADFAPSFADQLSFLYLEKKQNSRTGIARYREKGTPPAELLEKISDISTRLARERSLAGFCELLENHEQIIAEWMETEPVKARYFPDFPGAIKSLGAWGGDFVLVASERNFPAVKQYFSDRGYPTLVPFREMVLPSENASPNSN